MSPRLLLATAAALLAAPAVASPPAPIELDDVIAAVTVYSDQAAVTRAASLRLVAGEHQLAFDPLPGGAWRNTAQVDVQGATLLAVEVLPPWPAEGGGEQQEWRQRRSVLQEELQDLGRRYDDLAREVQLLLNLQRDPAARKEGELGVELMPRTVDEPVGRWQQQRFDGLASEAETLRAEARRVRDAMDQLDRELLPAPHDGRPRVVATVALERTATVRLAATVRVGGPRWVPDYDLHLDPAGGRGRVMVNALVSQATGEDWSGVPLRLSTATPGAAAELPQLSAWYLQEAAPEAPPTELLAMEADDYEEVAEAEAPRRRSKEKKLDRAKRSSRSRRAPAAPSASRGDYGLGSDEDTGAVSPLELPSPEPARGALSARQPIRQPGSPVELLLGPRPTGERLVVPPAITTPPPSGPTVNWSRFDPARQAGGFDYAYASAGPVDLPADGVARRIPLQTLDLAARFEHRVPAAVEQAAWLYALLEQDGQVPLLAGEARVFQAGDLLGNTILPKAARGATFEIPLGKDEQVRVERKVEQLADRSGPVAGGEAVSREVRLKLRNLRAEPAHLVVTDRVPISYDKGVKIEVTSEPRPAATQRLDGLLEWRLDLEAGADATITFGYAIRHPRNTGIWEQ